MFLVVAVCLCLVWTLWLIVLNIAPNSTINHVMGTQSFDDGAFWLLVESPQRLVLVAAFGLFVVAVIYLAIFIQILVSRQRMLQIHLTQQQPSAPGNSLTRITEWSLPGALTKARGGKLASEAVKLATYVTNSCSTVRTMAASL